MMDHPHIATIHDGGEEDGSPYFVMEYVDGLPITEFCEAKSLPLKARLNLFEQRRFASLAAMINALPESPRESDSENLQQTGRLSIGSALVGCIGVQAARCAPRLTILVLTWNELRPISFRSFPRWRISAPPCRARYPSSPHRASNPCAIADSS